MKVSTKRDVVVIAVGAGVGFGLGVLTAYAQGWLGASFGSLANSAGPWGLAALLVARRARSLPVGMVTAVATLALCEVGYVIANDIRGGANSRSTVVFWMMAAALAGPPLGLAAVWSRGDSPDRRVAAFGAIAGVLIGEASHGLTRIADTTSSGYWAGELLIGVALIVYVVACERTVRSALVGAAVGAAAALVVYVAAGIA